MNPQSGFGFTAPPQGGGSFAAAVPVKRSPERACLA